ncbi:hypothetical protein KEM48_001590 [Puccinia striiformis f. sp. tritici PST-130]|nr:hypothetical protein KEM48_001590 [Puccinia striiformis f. sp. tritici PST-130]
MSVKFASVPLEDDELHEASRVYIYSGQAPQLRSLLICGGRRPWTAQGKCFTTRLAEWRTELSSKMVQMSDQEDIALSPPEQIDLHVVRLQFTGRLRPRMIAGTTATHLTEVGSEIKAGESLVNARELVASGANSLPHGPQETWSLNSQQGRLPPLPSRTSPEPPHTSPFKAPSGGALGSKETASSKLAGFSEIKPKLAKYSRKVKEGFYDVFTWVQYQVYKIRTRSLRPPTKKELEKFNEVKEKISTDLALGAFYLNNQEKLDVESIAKRLDEKLSPPVNRYKPAEQAKPQASIYKDYVKKLELRQLSAIDLKDFQQKWESIKISTGLTDAEKLPRGR